MAHSSFEPEDNSKAIEQGYQPDNVSVPALGKFLVGLAIFMGVSFVLMYGLYVFLESQAAAADREAASPTAYSEKEIAEGKNLPPEPRLQAAPGFGVTTFDGQRVNLENHAPQSEYWTLEKEWHKVLTEGMKHNEGGKETVIMMPIEEGKKAFLAKQPAVRDLANVTDPTGVMMPSETSAGRVPGAKAAGMENPDESAGEAKKPETPAGAVKKPEPAASPKPTPTASPKAAAAGAGKR